ncbi:MAG TPA: hypothetical protein VEJ63_01265 [Planctomycetota bacterium]|nr:hypothetical protein [Planctomycetota bacterium]
MLKIDEILQTLNDYGVDYILIGGVNFLINHEMINTQDVDVWIADDEENHKKLLAALRKMGAAWGPTEREWKPVAENTNWIKKQPVLCLTTDLGALDVFRFVKGLDDYQASKQRAALKHTAAGVKFLSLSDEDMLRCQEVLDPREQKLDRMRTLREAIVRKQQP